MGDVENQHDGQRPEAEAVDVRDACDVLTLTVVRTEELLGVFGGGNRLELESQGVDSRLVVEDDPGMDDRHVELGVRFGGYAGDRFALEQRDERSRVTLAVRLGG